MRWLDWPVALVAGLTLGWLLAFGTRPSHPAVPAERTWGIGACVQLVVRPDTYACPDKHVWQDVGPVTPVPAVPK